MSFLNARHILPRALAPLLAALALWAPAAGTAGAAETRPLQLAYVDWSSSVASHNLVKAVLEERLDAAVVLRAYTADEMWRAVASGTADATLSAWLPRTHAEYWRRYGDDVVDAGPNLEGARIGLVVPDVNQSRQTGPHGARGRPTTTVDSVADLAGRGERFDRRIVGIDPEAGVMARTREAMRVYGLEDYRLLAGSEQQMIDALRSAVSRREPIVITGWQPHWIFARWKLKFLDDPRGVFGDDEAIHTVLRAGLREDRPKAAAVLDRFAWTLDDMEQLLIWNQQGERFPYENALRWMKLHPERVEDWLR